jgi:hypothetical protein
LILLQREIVQSEKMETMQVIRGRVNGEIKWSVVRVKEGFEGAVICSGAYDTFRDAAAELHRIYVEQRQAD